MYYLLTESFKSQEISLVAMITEAVPVEKIYMLGSSLQQQRTESIFMTDAPSCRNAGHYWLLVRKFAKIVVSQHLESQKQNYCVKQFETE
jgi:hypothetical protein